MVKNHQLVSKPERPPRAIDKINCALSLSNQNSINLTNNLQTCADLANNHQLVSKPERPPRAIDKLTSALALNYNTNPKPEGRGAFAVAPVPEGDGYFEECHYESMIYSRAYQAGMYTRTRVISSYKPKVMSRAIRKAKRFLRKKSEARTEANLEVKLTPHTEEQFITKSMSLLERASMKEAFEYEIERAKLNSKLSLSIHNQFETRTPEYRTISNDQEVVTGYPETIAPLVMDSSHRRCATCANTDRIVISSPEIPNTAYNDDEIISSISEQPNNEFGSNTKRPHAIAYLNPGLMTADTKRPYDEAHLCAGLLTYGAKAYSNAAVCMSTDAEAYYNAEAYESDQSSPDAGLSQTTVAIDEVHAPPRETVNKTASAIISHTATCATITNNALTNVHKNSMSSQRERIELVAPPPQHTDPCTTQLTIASAIKPMSLPRQSKLKNIPKNMSSSGCQNKDIGIDVPRPGQSNNTTSALKGFNHLSYLKGERIGNAVCVPSIQHTTNFSI